MLLRARLAISSYIALSEMCFLSTFSGTLPLRKPSTEIFSEKNLSVASLCSSTSAIGIDPEIVTSLSASFFSTLMLCSLTVDMCLELVYLKLHYTHYAQFVQTKRPLLEPLSILLLRVVRSILQTLFCRSRQILEPQLGHLLCP